MTHIDIAKTYIHAIQSGDQATLATLISPDVVWHQPGANRFSGTRRGIADVGSMLAQMMEISRGTFAITRANQFMVNGDWVAVTLEFAGERDGMRLDQQGIDVLRIEGGRIVEVRLFSSDQMAEDRFWGN